VRGLKYALWDRKKGKKNQKVVDGSWVPPKVCLPEPNQRLHSSRSAYVA
jgi:hypothetical protein